MKPQYRTLVGVIALVAISGCTTMQPLEPVEEVDLARFMGDWYVIANIPTAIEKNAHNAVENYRQSENGTIATTFTFRAKSFDGKQKTYRPKGFVSSESNAIWGMQFLWPFKSDFRIVYLDEDYQTTIIGRNKRDHVWLMARQPTMKPERLRKMTDIIESMGYDVSKLQEVPQRW